MRKGMILIFLILISAFMMTNLANPVEIEIQGQGSAEITSAIKVVEHQAKKEALINATKMALVRVLGLGAINDPQVQQKFEDIISQLNVYKLQIVDTARTEGNKYIINRSLIIDGKKFRQLLSEMGIAVNTHPGPSNIISTLMDQFVATPLDLRTSVPPSKVTIHKYDRDSKYKD